MGVNFLKMIGSESSMQKEAAVKMDEILTLTEFEDVFDIGNAGR